MDYERAQQTHTNVTYGWYVDSVVAPGPSAAAGVRSGDVLVGLNGTRIRNGDEMSSYLEEKTLPDETLILTVARGTQTLYLTIDHLGRRPPPP
jgi:S1-C subfamily serine protease